MKKLLLCLMASLTILITNAQLKRVGVLVGKNSDQVIRYLDSLNELRPNPQYHISRSAANNGDLILAIEFPMADEAFFKCFSLTLKFTRVEGTEICTTQLILGAEELAQNYLSFIKDTFERTQEGWERNLTRDGAVRLLAKYARDQEGSYSYFTITYSAKYK